MASTLNRGSKRGRRKVRAARYFSGVKEDLPRGNVKIAVKKGETEPLITRKRWFDYP